MSSESQDLLIEIGTEELPPKSLKSLSEAFCSAICAGLEQEELTYNVATPYATPRRLAVLLKSVATMQADKAVERRGPAIQAAYKDGQPTKAALGFAKSCGVDDVGQLETLSTDKGEWLVYRSVQSGQPTTNLIPDIIHAALASLPIAKRMRWGANDYEFVRPVHWVVIVFGHTEVPAQILGINSGRMTRGHRFHHPEAIEIINASDYAKLLEDKGHVIPVFSTRRQRIELLVQEEAELLGGLAVIDPDLLDEVTSLVEYPTAIIGSFDTQFLDVPAEALISTMKEHQRYFHLVDMNGKLLPHFVTISNVVSRDPDMIRLGNERVIRPRFSDAMFFWQQDRAMSLDSRLEALKTITFQKQLGSLYDKARRVAHLTGVIAKQGGVDELQGIRAGQLSKCDLVTEMVGEFPELQGIMGEYYAKHDGETDAVATALREQYMPRFFGDVLPETPIGQALSVADKLDTLVGIFGLGQVPTGDRDPFGLRRAAFGVLRVLIECELPLNLAKLLQMAQRSYGIIAIAADTHAQVFDFMLERMRGYYQDQHVNLDSIDAVMSCRPDSPYDAHRRILGVEAFRQMPEAESLAAANKRIHNILKKTDENYPTQPDPTYFDDAAERQLFDKLAAVTKHIQPALQQGDYVAALQGLADLRETVDTFFDKVMVMVEDETVRRNRLAFLSKVRQTFLQVADVSKLQGEK